MISHILLGFGVSFVGSLPLGVLNLTAIEMAVSRRFYQVLLFALGAIIVEFGQAYLGIYFSDYLMSHPSINRVIQIAVIPLFLFIGVMYLLSSYRKHKKQQKATSKGNESVKNRKVPPFVKGLMLSMINPLAIPYWLAVSSSLRAAGQLSYNEPYILCFVIGIVLGTYVALVMYGGLGEVLETKLKRYEKYFNPVIGLVLIGLAVAQFCKVCL